MAGVTDLPFRLLCKEQGADLICTEMISAKGILYNNKNTEQLLRIDDRERPVSLQLFGSDPDIVSEMAKRIEDRNFDILDIRDLHQHIRRTDKNCVPVVILIRLHKELPFLHFHIKGTARLCVFNVKLKSEMLPDIAHISSHKFSFDLIKKFCVCHFFLPN